MPLNESVVEASMSSFQNVASSNLSKSVKIKPTIVRNSNVSNMGDKESSCGTSWLPSNPCPILNKSVGKT